MNTFIRLVHVLTKLSIPSFCKIRRTHSKRKKRLTLYCLSHVKIQIQSHYECSRVDQDTRYPANLFHSPRVVTGGLWQDTPTGATDLCFFCSFPSLLHWWGWDTLISGTFWNHEVETDKTNAVFYKYNVANLMYLPLYILYILYILTGLFPLISEWRPSFQH